MRLLIAAQSAFCFIVLLVAGLFITTFERLSNQTTGFSSDRILNLETISRRPQQAVFWRQALEHLRATSGVETAAMTMWPLMSGESAVSFVSIDGAAPAEMFCDLLNVSPGWFDVMKIPLIDGRDFRAEDGPVAIVNQAFAKQYFDDAKSGRSLV